MREFTADQENAFEDAVRELMAQAIETADALKHNKRELGLAGFPGFAMDEVRLREKTVAVKAAMRALRLARHNITPAEVSR